MGSSSNSTTVVEQNTTVIINAINSAANTNPGTFSPIPQGTPAAAVEQQLQTSLLKTLNAAWTARFPSTPITGGNLDSAFLLVNGTLSSSTPVTCAVASISQDLANWQVTTGPNLPTTIANQILNAILMEGGLVAMSSGILTLGPAQAVGWAVATLTAQAGAAPNNVNLIGYSFSAANVSPS